MASEKRKKFQSGREIFRTYIPGYAESAAAEEPALSPRSPADAGAELAAELLQQFDSYLETLELNRSSKVRRSRS